MFIIYFVPTTWAQAQFQVDLLRDISEEASFLPIDNDNVIRKPAISTQIDS